MDGPPVVESFIWAYIEAMLRWRCLSECVGNFGAIDEHVFDSGDGIE